MTVGVLSSPEAIYPFDHVQAAEPSVTSLDALALNDGVRIMKFVCLA